MTAKSNKQMVQICKQIAEEKRINFQNLLIHLLTGKCKNRQIRSNKTFFLN